MTWKLKVNYRNIIRRNRQNYISNCNTIFSTATESPCKADGICCFELGSIFKCKFYTEYVNFVEFFCVKRPHRTILNSNHSIFFIMCVLILLFHLSYKTQQHLYATMLKLF